MDIKQRRLPSAYQEVEYIQSSGTQYIDTNLYIPNSNSSVKVNCKFRYVGTQSRASIFGCQIAGSMCISPFLWLDAGRHLHIYCGGSAYIPGAIPYSFDTDNIVEMNANNGTIITNWNGTTYNYNYVENLPTGVSTYLFASNYGGATQFCTARMYFYKEEIDGAMVRDFVPCYRKSDGVIGMYDMVGRQFYTNQGSGTFTRGGVVEPSDLKFNQQVLNGNFASGTTNWTTTNASDITTSNGEISFKNTSTSSASSLKQTRGSWYPNNIKYLLVLKAKLDFTSGAFYWTFCGKSVSITPIMDSAYHSYEALATSTNTSATWIDLYTRPTDGTGKLIHFKDIMIINLTQMYGAGNEPTDIDTIKADCANIGHSLDVYQEFKA